jgi:hypothetical protein
MTTLLDAARIVKEFWNRVNKDGPVPAHCPELGPCWVWTASKFPGLFNYGLYHAASDTIRAHRFAYESAVGPIPEGFEVMHRCDNPACVRPEHLRTGTHQENMQDCAEKGRHWTATNPERLTRGDAHHMRARAAEFVRRGEAAPRAKLTADQVREIRQAFAIGEKKRPLARRFCVDRRAIDFIVRRKHWRHVE